MNFYEEIKKYLDNNLFTNYALEVDFPNIYNFTKNENTYKTILDNIICLYDATQRNFQIITNINLKMNLYQKY